MPPPGPVSPIAQAPPAAHARERASGVLAGGVLAGGVLAGGVLAGGVLAGGVVTSSIT